MMTMRKDDQAWEQAIAGCSEWLDQNPDYDIQIIFAVRKKEVKDVGDEMLLNLDNRTRWYSANFITT